MFLAQEGCGAAAEPGRLEIKMQDDSADGCGSLGGLPLAEARHETSGPQYEHYTSTSKLPPVLLDTGKKITGQLAAASWIGFGIGAGDVTFHVRLIGHTKNGTTVDFGTTSATINHEPGTEVDYVPFALSAPSAAKGKVFTEFRLSVFQHGTNVGMSSKQLSGDSYVTFPLRKK